MALARKPEPGRPARKGQSSENGGGSFALSFQQFDYGAGAALNTVLLIIALLVAPVYIRLNRDSLRQG